MVIAAIESPFALLQEPVKIVLFDAIELPQMPLGLIPKILDSVDMVLTPCKQL